MAPLLPRGVPWNRSGMLKRDHYWPEKLDDIDKMIFRPRVPNHITTSNCRLKTGE
jgi:hypothetical protein